MCEVMVGWGEVLGPWYNGAQGNLEFSSWVLVAALPCSGGKTPGKASMAPAGQEEQLKFLLEVQKEIQQLNGHCLWVVGMQVSYFSWCFLLFFFSSFQENKILWPQKNHWSCKTWFNSQKYATRSTLLKHIPSFPPYLSIVPQRLVFRTYFKTTWKTQKHKFQALFPESDVLEWGPEICILTSSLNDSFLHH